MKIFASIMAFLILAFSTMPCGDKEHSMSEGKTNSGFEKSGHQQSDKEQDACSPFCYCTCCAGFSLNHFLTPFISLPAFFDTPTTNYLHSEATEVALTIWQPPRFINYFFV